MSFEDLPTELRDMVYNDVVKTDDVVITSKTPRGGCMFSSKLLLAFSSAQMQQEYRNALIRRMMNTPGRLVTVNVADFNFKNLTTYLRMHERAGSVGRFSLSTGHSQLVIELRLTRNFDGDTEKAVKWMGFINGLSQRSGVALPTTYWLAIPQKTSSIENFLSTLQFDYDLDPDSEWAKILIAIQDYLIPLPNHERYDNENAIASDFDSEFEGEFDGGDDSEAESDLASDDGESTESLQRKEAARARVRKGAVVYEAPEMGNDDFARELDRGRCSSCALLTDFC